MAAMIDEYLCALADEYRRQLLLVLLDREANEDVPVPEAVARDDDDLMTVRIEFHHLHFPKLEKLGLVDWDRETDLVTKGPNYETVQPLVEVINKIKQSTEEDA